ncbi:MAG: alpha/beta hydrolase [Chloroflexi bacterium]|nr:alpha/beta hydrolase [Chloroflexota bacterium]
MPDTTTGIAEINGTKIYYEFAGEGRGLVLIHDEITDSRMWDDQFQVFAEHYRVVRLDLRGYGRSEMVAGDFAHHEDVRDLLKVLTIDRAYFLGCALGGRVAIDYTLVYPEMVAGVITVGGTVSGYRNQTGPIPQEKDLSEALARNDLEQANELQLQMWVDGPQRTPDQVGSAVREQVRAMNAKNLQTQFGVGNEQIVEPRAITRLYELQTPVLAIVGQLDQPVAHAVADAMVAGIAGAKKSVIYHAAHLPNMERPAEFNQVVLTYLAHLND